jgi:hypothetical protein
MSQEFSQEEISDIEEKTINYITNEDFEGLNTKFYSVRELTNLLGSSETHQRSFALRLLNAALPKVDLPVLLNPDHTNILERLLQLTQSQQRLEVTMQIIEVYEGIIKKWIPVMKERDSSFVREGAMLWRNNHRMHNIQLCEFVEGASERKVMRRLVNEEEYRNVRALIKKVNSVIEQVRSLLVINVVQYLFGGDKEAWTGQVVTALNLMGLIGDYDKESSHLVHSELAETV